MRRHRWWHWWRGGYGGLCSTRVLQNETKRYTIHHRVIHVQVHVCFSRPNGKRHDELFKFSSRVARDPRLYSHDDERSSDGTFFQKRLAMPPSLFRRVLPSLLLYRYLYIITILFPPIFCFRRKVAEDFSLLNFFFFFFHKL